MEAGKLRHRLTHQRATEVHGQRATWTTVGTYWGSISTLGGNEQGGEQQVTAEATHRLTIRGAGVMITSTDRFLFGSRVFQVLTWDDIDARGVELRITVKEVK